MDGDGEGDFYQEMEEKWGKRAARGLRTCVRGKETLSFGTTGGHREAGSDDDDDGPPRMSDRDVALRSLAARRIATEACKLSEREIVSKGGSRASQRRKKKSKPEEEAPTTVTVTKPQAVVKTKKKRPVEEAPLVPESSKKKARHESLFATSPSQIVGAKPRKQKEAKTSTPKAKTTPKSEKKTSVFAKSPSEVLGKRTGVYARSPTDVVGGRKQGGDEKVGVPRCLGESLWVRDMELGDGLAVKDGGKVSVLYTARFHSTRKRFDHRSNPNLPFVFVVGAGSVVEGFDRGLVGMRVGGEREIVIPPPLAYGEKGVPPKIPPNAALHFLVKLLPNKDDEEQADVKKAGETQGCTTFDRTLLSASSDKQNRRRPRGVRGGGGRAKKTTGQPAVCFNEKQSNRKRPPRAAE